MHFLNLEWPHQPEFKSLESAENSDLESQVFYSEIESIVFSNTVAFARNAISKSFPIDTERYSSFSKTCRITVYALRFLKLSLFKSNGTEVNARKKISNFLSDIKIAGSITAAEIQTAKKILIRKMQIERPPTDSEFINLALFFDDKEIIRSRGRLLNSELKTNAKFPIFLPDKHHLTELLVLECHEKNFHAGVSHTLSSIREHFWLLRGRRTVRKIIKKCFYCKRILAKPFELPKMPHLPSDRVTRSPPFAKTGLDYFGPVKIKLGENIQKIWVALFTCFVVRAVHLEIAMDNSAETFLNCLRRFISRRGCPQKILSDNAKGFKLADGTLDLAWKSTPLNLKIQNYCSENGISWGYITERAPWKGGVYERMIGLVKNSLRKMIKPHSTLSLDAFSTLLIECESIVNTRPLTNLTENPDDFSVLRPLDFLIPYEKIFPGTPNIGIPEQDPDYEPPDFDSRQKLLKIWKHSQKYLETFWLDWRENYLKSLREYHVLRHRNPRSKNARSPRIGELVIIEDESPRGTWQLARVIEIFADSYGVVRSAIVRTQSGTLKRSVSAIYPLEVEAMIEKETNNINKQDADVQKIPSDSAPRSHNKEEKTVNQALRRHLYNLRARKMPSLRTIFFTTLFFLSIFYFKIVESQMLDNSLLKIECASRGVEVFVAHSVRQFRVCSKPFCFERNKPNSHEFIDFPKTVLLYNQDIKVHFWIESDPRERTLNLECPPIPACELIDCYFCYERLANPSCTPLICLILLAIILYISLSILYTTLRILAAKITFFVAKTFTTVARFFGKIISKFFNPIKSCLGRRPMTEPEEELAPLTPLDTPVNENVRRRNSLRTMLQNFRLSPAILAIVFTLEFQPANGYVNYSAYNSTTSHSYLEFYIKKYLALHLIWLGVIFVAYSAFLLYNILITFENLYPGFIRQISQLFLRSLRRCFKFLAFFCAKFFQIFKFFFSRRYTRAHPIIFTSCPIHPPHPAPPAPSYPFMMDPGLQHPFFGLAPEPGPPPPIPIFQALLPRPPSPEPRASAPRRLPRPTEWSQTLDSEGPNGRRRIRVTTHIVLGSLIVFSLFSCLPSVRSIDCSEIQSFTVDNSACIRKKNSLECKISTSTIISVPPHCQTSCFLLKNSTSHPLGTLEIKFDEIGFICHPISRHFTRYYKLKEFSAKQCAAFGSCVGSKCSDLKTYELIPELEVVSEKPGHNFCMETCGFLSCGCPTPTAACLFYRIYAEEIEPKTAQEIFSCPYWHPSITLEVNETTNNSTRSFKIILSPGETWNNDNLKAALLSQVTPHSSILNSFFISNGSHIALLDDDLFENSKIFRCGTLKDALEFKCNFSPDSCLCLGAEKRVNCQCKVPLFGESYKKNLLPLTLPSLTIQEYTSGNIKATFQQDTALQIQVNFLDYPLVSVFDDSLCWIKPQTVVGCYRCRTGAEFTFSCSSENEGSVAHILCDSLDFYTTCSPRGIFHRKRLDISKAVINETCRVMCSGGETSFRIYGSLYFFPETQNFTWHYSPSALAPPSDIDFKAILDWLLEDWRRWVAIVFVTFTLILATTVITCGPCSPLFFLRKIKNN